MAQHDLEITVTKEGEVTVRVKGARGKACFEYTKYFTELVGKLKEKGFAAEEYEPERKARIDLQQEQKRE